MSVTGAAKKLENSLFRTWRIGGSFSDCTHHDHSTDPPTVVVVVVVAAVVKGDIELRKPVG